MIGRVVSGAVVALALLAPLQFADSPAAAATPAAKAPAAPAKRAAAPADTDEQNIDELVIANHILADQGVLDGFGHISVRSVKNPHHYFMSVSRAPALVTRADIIEFDENSQPVIPTRRELYSERFIHGEIYRVRPDVQSVAHGHTPAVLPFTVTSAPLKAMIHVGYFLGTEPAPVFDLRSADGDDNQMLINHKESGAALAKTLGDRAVVLIRGHGMAVVGPSIKDTVFRSVYTMVNAQAEAAAMQLGQPVFMNKYEVNRTDRIDRHWDLWVRRVQAGK